MSIFYIVAKVNDTEYLTKVSAESACQAEHMFLDRGIMGKHEYGCSACMAYDAKAMKTDAFIGAAVWAWPVSVDELVHHIDENNERIMKRDAVEEAIAMNEKKLKEMQEAIKQLQNEIAEAKKALKA